MFKNDIIEYFDSIEPSDELIERTVNMSKNNKKIAKLPKRAVAILVAAIIMLVGVTGYAAVTKIKNNDKGMAIETGSCILFDFTKSDNTPDRYSVNDNEIVNALVGLGYDNIVLPRALCEDTEIAGVNPFITETSNSIDFKSKKYDSPTLYIINNVERKDMNNFFGTGDEDTIGEIININGIDVCLTIQGNEEFGYKPCITYVVDDTMFHIYYTAGTNQEKAYKSGIEFVNTIEQ